MITVPHAALEGTTHKALVDQLAGLLFHSRAGSVIPKIILTTDDIDPTTNVEEVFWALSTMCHPVRDQYIFLPTRTSCRWSLISDRRNTETGARGAEDDLLLPAAGRRATRAGAPPQFLPPPLAAGGPGPRGEELGELRVQGRVAAARLSPSRETSSRASRPAGVSAGSGRSVPGWRRAGARSD